MKRLLKQTAVFGLSGAFSLSAYSLWSGNEKFYSNVAMPLVHALTDGEQGHNLAIKMAKLGLVPKSHKLEDESILVNLSSFS